MNPVTLQRLATFVNVYAGEICAATTIPLLLAAVIARLALP